jgi:hypothetical protein
MRKHEHDRPTGSLGEGSPSFLMLESYEGRDDREFLAYYVTVLTVSAVT